MGPWCEECGLRRASDVNLAGGFEVCDLCSADIDKELDDILNRLS